MERFLFSLFALGTLYGSTPDPVAPKKNFLLDEQEKRMIEHVSPRTLDRMTQEEPLSLSDIIKLSQATVHDETILAYLEQEGSLYTLTQSQLRRLKDQGVSHRIIEKLLTSSTLVEIAER